MFMRSKQEKCHRTTYPASTTNNDTTNNERRFQTTSSSPGRLGFPRPQVIENACRQQRTTPHITHRLVTRGGARCERRNSLNIQSCPGCRSCARDSQQRGSRRRRGPCSRRHVNGCG